MSNKILNICQSKLKESKSTFIWMIENFPDRLNQYLDSGIFRSTSPNGDTLGWGLRIYTSTSLEAPPYFGISIHRVDSATEVSAKIKFMIRNSAGMDVIELTIPNRIYTNCHPYQQQPIYYLISRNELLDVRNGLMQGNQLTIVFEVTIFGKPSLEMRSSIFDEFEVPECSGMEDLGNLFEQGLFADCTIIAAADGTKFNAHKGILACRSPVFRAMFEHGMIEAKGIVKIKDIKSPVLEQMIRFIYSGKAPKLGEMTEELFEAADQYKLDRLKILCESELAKTMSNENVCELLVLADQHCANNLKTYAIKYIQMNAKEVMKSIGWKMVIKGNHAELMGQIMKAFTE